MITAKQAIADYEAIMKENIPADEKVAKILRIVIKLLLSIRTNQRGGVKTEIKK
jgi:hypothetical protein